MRIALALRAPVVVFALSLAGCAGFSGLFGGEGEPAAENKPVAKSESKAAAKKKPAGTKAVIKDTLIVAGKRIGPVSVGMPVSQLYDVMGEPVQAVKGRGSERYVFEDLQVVVDEADGAVVTVLTESPDYASADGLKVGLTDLAVKAGLAKLQGQLVIKEEGDTTTYFASGISVVVTGGLVKSISVRPVSGGPSS
jgi:hypothetical protein